MRAALALVGLVGGLGVARADLPKVTYFPAAPRAADATPLAGITIYLNRCVGGCDIKPGGNDATTNASDIAMQAAHFDEYAWAPGEWEGIVQCVKEVYSPYNLKITDTRPGPADGFYNEVIVGGSAEQIGQSGSCGFGEFSATPCAATSNAVAFTFTGSGSDPNGCHDDFASEDPDGMGTGVFGTCWVIAQETAHSFGLDHEYQFEASGMSACNDPMTYRSDCGGQKFFRNDYATCGEFTKSSVHECGAGCGNTQNSHQELLNILGPGTPITKPPVLANNAPADGATIMAGTNFFATGSAQRGIATVELWMNGYKWGSAPGAAFGPNGQASSAYNIAVPADLPDSKYDVVMKAFDDIGIEGDAPMLHVVKGKASGCDPSVQNADGTVDTCLLGQTCSDGKCAWADAGKGMFGDACTYPQYCSASTCQGDPGAQICTHVCDTSIADSCPMGYSCVATASGQACFPGSASDGGGCCSTGASGMPAAMLSIATLGIVLRRRRKVH